MCHSPVTSGSKLEVDPTVCHRSHQDGPHLCHLPVPAWTESSHHAPPPPPPPCCLFSADSGPHPAAHSPRVLFTRTSRCFQSWGFTPHQVLQTLGPQLLNLTEYPCCAGSLSRCLIPVPVTSCGDLVWLGLKMPFGSHTPSGKMARSLLLCQAPLPSPGISPDMGTWQLRPRLWSVLDLDVLEPLYPVTSSPQRW